MDRQEDFTTRQFEGFDGAFDEIRFKGESSERFKSSCFMDMSMKQENGTKVGTDMRNMISKCERQSCESAIQCFNGLLVDEERNDANEGDAFLAYPRFFVGIACDNDFAEGVMHVGQ